MNGFFQWFHFLFFFLFGTLMTDLGASKNAQDNVWFNGAMKNWNWKWIKREKQVFVSFFFFSPLFHSDEDRHLYSHETLNGEKTGRWMNHVFAVFFFVFRNVPFVESNETISRKAYPNTVRRQQVKRCILFSLFGYPSVPEILNGNGIDANLW